MSQTWHETGEGSDKHQRRPNAAGNTLSDACSLLPARKPAASPALAAKRPSCLPTAALAPWLLSPACARLRASGSAEKAAPTTAPPRRRRHRRGSPGAVPASSSTSLPRSAPALGLGLDLGSRWSGRASPAEAEWYFSRLIYSLPGLLRGECRTLGQHELHVLPGPGVSTRQDLNYQEWEYGCIKQARWLVWDSNHPELLARAWSGGRVP